MAQEESGNAAHIDELKDGELIPRGEQPRRQEVVTQASTVGLIAAAEIDQQIATAHRFPRSISVFKQQAMSLATENERVAGECLFALPRDGKVIEGPSIRLAEIIASSWRNCRVASRTVLEGAETVVAQGIFHDLENNVAITSETQRRIVDKNGRRFKLDMIVTTSNAAQSIALRNAIVRGVPRAIWWDVYLRARKVAAGNEASLATKRASAIAMFQIWGITEAQILELLEKHGIDDIGREDLVVLLGVYNSIKDGETTPEDAFPKKVDVAALVRGNREAKASDEQKVADVSAGDQAVVGTPTAIQKEPTPEQAAAQAAKVAASQESEAKVPARKNRAAQGSLE